jgi:tRNA(Ile2) C34 agmatinyltransferase TiaS
LRKKGITIWLFSTLTALSLMHLIEAITVILFNSQPRLLQLYPFINQQLQQIPATTYLYITAASTVTLWGITCLIAFDNPVETFLNKILSDAKQQAATDTQIIENKGELFEIMYETVDSNTETLAQVKDMMRNVRAEVKDIQPVKETLEKTRTEIGSLKRQIKTIEEKLLFANILCPTCGKPLQSDFNICPYCGENIKLSQKIVMVQDYK